MTSYRDLIELFKDKPEQPLQSYDVDTYFPNDMLCYVDGPIPGITVKELEYRSTNNGSRGVGWYLLSYNTVPFLFVSRGGRGGRDSECFAVVDSEYYRRAAAAITVNNPIRYECGLDDDAASFITQYYCNLLDPNKDEH